MNEPCLHPAFDPARTLLMPDRVVNRRVFDGAPSDNIDTVTKASEPHSKIGILGDIIGVPPTNGQGMNGGSDWMCRPVG